MDQYDLCCKPPGKRTPDDDWVEKTSVALFAATPEQAAEIAAAALSEGIAPDAVQEAISVAANQMVLRDENKQAHGSTNGVHCCDAVNAWRHIARVSSAKNACAATVLAAYHFAFDRDNPKRNKFQEWLPYPRAGGARRGEDRRSGRAAPRARRRRFATRTRRALRP